MSAVATARTVQRRFDRWSLGVFVVVVVLAVPLLLYLGRDQWFYRDEWFVLGDGSERLDGFFDAHNGHWSTVVTIVFRVNYALWGLHTYLPYQVPVVLAHVGSAVLLRVVMRRLGVRGWIATAAALVFVFFGTGSLNIFFGFALSQTGSLFCGLAYLLLGDRDGQLDRRDGFALAVGLVGLMTSGIFVAMVVGVGAAVLIRRGLLVAAFYTVPLGVIYGVWYLLYGREDSVVLSSSLGAVLRFISDQLSGTFTSLAQSDLGGLALGLAVLGALAVVLTHAVRTRQWTPLALPAGLLTAWVAFASLTAVARAGGFFVLIPGSSARYLHISAALFLPLIALAAEFLARRNALAGVLPVLVLVAGLPGNVDALIHRPPSVLGSRAEVVTLAHSEHIDDVSADRQPLRVGNRRMPITTGWLSREAKVGHIPTPTKRAPGFSLRAYGLLALLQRGAVADERQCPPADARRVRLVLDRGERIVFEGNINIVVTDGRHQSHPIGFESWLGSTIVVELGRLDVAVTNKNRALPPRICEPRQRG